MVFKDCHLLQIQIITNAELAPTICMFAIFYKIWCYQTDKSDYSTAECFVQQLKDQPIYHIKITQMVYTVHEIES